MQVQAYLNFDGRCEEALEFYRRALDAQITLLMRFKDNPEKHNPEVCASDITPPPDLDNKVMHSSFRVGDTTLMASDCNAQGRPAFQGISLTLNAADEAQAKRFFNALADGGQVHMPLTKTFFSPSFGMVADRFGVSWMIIVPAPEYAR